MSKKSMTLAQKRSVQGYLYILPWIIGILLFFITPIVWTGIYAFNTMDKSTLELTFVGWQNFITAFRKDADFPKMLLNFVISLKDILLILIFSFFVAMLLKQKFLGNTLVKSIFFITIILSSEIFIQMQDITSGTMNAQMNTAVEETQGTFAMLKSIDLSEYFSSIGISTKFTDYLSDEISNIFNIMVRSGIQVFIFLAALHSIPDSMYEASSIEGASAWESFWKITFPMCGPMILVNFVYTVVDTFGSNDNEIVQYINKISFTNFNFGYSSALSWIYFLCVSAVIGLVFLTFGKRVFYYN